MSLVVVVAIAVAAFVAVALVVLVVYARNNVKVPPDTVAAVTGRGPVKYVVGGSFFRIPILQRYDLMSLAPFDINVSTKTRSVDGVEISITASAWVKFGSTTEAIKTATERFLRVDRVVLTRQLTDTIAGHVRAICATMTVEALNGDRETLKRQIMAEVGPDLDGIGMVLDIFTIQAIDDQHGYMDALGAKRTADVQRDATLARAAADRDAKIGAAQSQQAARVAQAEAEAVAAEAERQLALKRAEIDAEVEAAQARAAQAGPLAQAEARRAVELANVETQKQAEQAGISLEEQRAARKQQAVQADVIIPAEAEKKAAIARAEGERESAILAAQADAEQRKLAGTADAEARKAAAGAVRLELEEKAAGDLATATAQAEGQRKLAEALNAYSQAAARQQVLPAVIAMLPELARAVAEGVNIDRVVVMDGGSGTGGSALERAVGTTPVVMAKVMEVAQTLGIDLGSFLGGVLNVQPTDVGVRTATDRTDTDATPASAAEV